MNFPRPHPTHFTPIFHFLIVERNIKNIKTQNDIVFGVFGGFRPRDHAYSTEHQDAGAIRLNESSVPNPTHFTPILLFPISESNIKNIKTENVLDHGDLVHGGARARARASRPQPCMAFLCTVARARARARARASRPQSWRQEIILVKIRFRGIKSIF